MATEMSEEKILKGIREGNNAITRQYFYEYCRIAYCIYDKKYGIRNLPGMDFYSLAHEYYLSLCKHNFKQLEDRNPQVSLKTWMVNGFRFVLLDKLKAVQKEHRMDSFEERVAQSSLHFDIKDNDYKEECRKMINDICCSLGRDNRNSIILQMLFIEGFKSKEIASQLGMTPSAISQRYHQLMRDYVIPFFKNYYESGEGIMAETPLEATSDITAECGMPSPMYTSNITPILMEQHRITPSWIDHLENNEIFVFGSNLQGMHGGGAARVARLHFGAIMGQGVGLQGQSYAIPTMQGGVETIRPYVDEFIDYARSHPALHFLVTPIGCGIAGFTAHDIAPLFAEATEVKNISLPKEFWEELA